MSSNEKVIAVIVSVLLGSLACCFGIAYLWSLYRMDSVRTYNRDFEKTYRESLLSQNLDIVSEERSIEVRSEWLFGVNVSSERVNEDIYGESYRHRFEVHDRQIDYDYEVSIYHDPREKLQADDDAIAFYRELAEIYEKNFELMRGIIEEHGGRAEQISVFDADQMEYYLLLVYLPDADAMIETQDDLYDKVYGGYAWEHVDKTHDINISIPRFIFCSNEETYDCMRANLDVARKYVRGKKYKCHNSSPASGKILLRDVCGKLLGSSASSYAVTEVPGVNTLGSPMTKNYLYGITSSDWIALYELEIGIDYYLTVFER